MNDPLWNEINNDTNQPLLYITGIVDSVEYKVLSVESQDCQVSINYSHHTMLYNKIR